MRSGLVTERKAKVLPTPSTLENTAASTVVRKPSKPLMPVGRLARPG